MNAYRPVTPHERTSYRRYLKENHPDVGGDPETFTVGLARLRATFSNAPAPRQPDRCPSYGNNSYAWDGYGYDRYDAPIVIVSDTDRMRRRLRRIWRRMRRREPPRVL